MAGINYSSPVYHGVGVHFGVNSTTVTGAGTFKIQSTDHSATSAVDTVQDGTGFAVQKTYYDFSEGATLDVVITSGSNVGNVIPTIAAPSDVITITDSVYTQLAGSTWLVDNVSIKRSNTSAMRVSYSLSRHPLITS